MLRSSSELKRCRIGATDGTIGGGLRGALALALALGLPTELPRRNELVTAAFAVVAFSIFVQGLTMTPLLRRLQQLGNGSRGDVERHAAASPSEQKGTGGNL